MIGVVLAGGFSLGELTPLTRHLFLKMISTMLGWILRVECDTAMIVVTPLPVSQDDAQTVLMRALKPVALRAYRLSRGAAVLVDRPRTKMAS